MAATADASRSRRCLAGTVWRSPSTRPLSRLPKGDPVAATVSPMREMGLQSAAVDSLDAPTLYDLIRLRVDVFVVEQRCPYAELDGRDVEPGTRHLWVSDGERAVAYLRVLVEPDGTLRIGRVCVAEPHRGAGLAHRLVTEALRQIAATDPRADVVLDAQSHLVGWYERLTFCADGEEFVEDGIPHVPMRLGRRG